MAVQLTILGSGSAGNCAYLETEQTRILIDAGLSGRQIRERLATIGRSLETLQAILVTHEHTDHIQGLTALSARLQIPVYCNRPTQEAIQRYLEAPVPSHIFSTGASFEVGDVFVETFPVPHDAQDPVGFLLRTGEVNLGFLTDLGHATKLVVERVRCAHVLVLETNHDLKLLQEDRHRPWSVKQRILSRHGHLSNDAAADVAEQIGSSDLRHLYLGHLSRECNRPELALESVRGRLEKIGARQIRVECTSQKTPCATLQCGEGGAPSCSPGQRG